MDYFLKIILYDYSFKVTWERLLLMRILHGENDWGMISKNPPMYESGVDNAVVEVTDIENKIHKITFKKGGVLNVGREGDTLYLAWDDSDTLNF